MFTGSDIASNPGPGLSVKKGAVVRLEQGSRRKGNMARASPRQEKQHAFGSESPILTPRRPVDTCGRPVLRPGITKRSAPERRLTSAGYRQVNNVISNVKLRPSRTVSRSKFDQKRPGERSVARRPKSVLACPETCSIRRTLRKL
jgi:hypothetical protein